YLLVDAELRLDLLRLMVNQDAELVLLLARPAADDEHRDVLGERPADGIHHVVPTGAVGDAHHAEPPGRARVPVGGEADTRLVREGDDLEAAGPPQPREEAKHEVARNAEEVADADLLEVGDQEVAEAHPRSHRIPGGPCGARARFARAPLLRCPPDPRRRTLPPAAPLESLARFARSGRAERGEAALGRLGKEFLHVAGGDADGVLLAAPEDLERDVIAGAVGPEEAIERAPIAHALLVDGEDHVTHLEPRLLARTTGPNSRDHDVVLDGVAEHPEPGPSAGGV